MFPVDPSKGVCPIATAQGCPNQKGGVFSPKKQTPYRGARQCYQPALIEPSFRQGLIGRKVNCLLIYIALGDPAPTISRQTPGREGVDLKGQVFLRTPSKSGFDNPAKSDILEGSASPRVIDATQRDPGFIVIEMEIVSKEALLDECLKSTLLTPSGYCARFLLPQHRPRCQQGGAVIGGGECVEILQDELHLLGPTIGQQT